MNDYDNDNYKNKNDKIEKLMRKLKEKARDELIARRMKEKEQDGEELELNIDSSLDNAIDGLANEYAEAGDKIEEHFDMGDGGGGGDDGNDFYNEDAREA